MLWVLNRALTVVLVTMILAMRHALTARAAAMFLQTPVGFRVLDFALTVILVAMIARARRVTLIVGAATMLLEPAVMRWVLHFALTVVLVAVVGRAGMGAAAVARGTVTVALIFFQTPVVLWVFHFALTVVGGCHDAVAFYAVKSRLAGTAVDRTAVVLPRSQRG